MYHSLVGLKKKWIVSLLFYTLYRCILYIIYKCCIIIGIMKTVPESLLVIIKLSIV